MIDSFKTQIVNYFGTIKILNEKWAYAAPQ